MEQPTDDAVFERMMRPHLPVLYAYLRCRTREPDDVLQETVLAVWQNLKVYRGDSSFRTFILAVARRKLADAYRKEYRNPTLPLTDDISDNDFSDTICECVDVGSALDTLTQRDRELVFLVYNAGLPLADIARMLGIPVGTVKSRLSAIRAKLRKYLEEDA
ncbi:MAG: RNA polymerase sigma factor [Clostridiales bacterium]|jgi:RNA polymerase sigma factor (sigma-70 family)|nr:RNA polymerase sigma factor [Clostridiales bacterium]